LHPDNSLRTIAWLGLDAPFDRATIWRQSRISHTELSSGAISGSRPLRHRDRAPALCPGDPVWV